MSDAIDNLQAAMARGLAVRPAVGGFPSLAEALRQGGVRHNVWHLPSAQSLYLTDAGPVVHQGQPVATGMVDVPPFDRDAVVTAIREDQAGRTTFEEFLAASWAAGVVRYDVALDERTVTYCGLDGDCYVEAYPAVTLPETPSA